MKKSLKISLGGIAFNIEDDAFQVLEKYIAALKEHLKGAAEADEVIRDIEERAAELFSELLGGKEIITLTMVNQVIEVLGKPEQITDQEAETDTTFTNANSRQNTKRRLYRDTDEAIIAGNCSGLGAYFNVDPLILRILFLILFFAKGLGFILYFVLWIVVPRAQTVRQRMEMRGEEINFSNLEKNIKNELEEVQKSMKRHRLSGLFERIFSTFGHFFLALGSIFAVVAKVIAAILAVVFISIGLAGMLGTLASLFLNEIITTLYPTFSGFTIVQLLGTTFDIGSVLWITIPVFIIIFLPFLGLILLGLRMVFKFNAHGSVIFVTSASVWIVAVMLLAFVTFLQARSFTISETIKDRVELVLADEDATTLQLIADEDFEYGDINPEKVISFEDYTIAHTHGQTKVVGKPKIFIGKSEGDNFEMVIIKKSRGGTRQRAKQSADRVALEYSLVETKLIISPYFFLASDEKWRAQEVVIYINVPEGKRIFIERNVEKLLSTDQSYCLCWPDEMVGNTWLMKHNKLVKQF